MSESSILRGRQLEESEKQVDYRISGVSVNLKDIKKKEKKIDDQVDVSVCNIST